MKTFRFTYHTRGEECYDVEAESLEEAEKLHEEELASGCSDPVSSEVVDSHLIIVEHILTDGEPSK